MPQREMSSSPSLRPRDAVASPDPTAPPRERQSSQPYGDRAYEREGWKHAPSREITHDEGENAALASRRRQRENAPLEGREDGEAARIPVPTLASPGFESGSWLPFAHAADGAAVSPPLRWSGLPAATRSVMILLDTGDVEEGEPGRAAVNAHASSQSRRAGEILWLVYNLAPEPPLLPAGAGNGLDDVPVEAYPVRASHIALPYQGPPPTAEPRDYCFRLFALDALLADANAHDPARLLEEATDHVLATAELRVTYGPPVTPKSEMF